MAAEDIHLTSLTFRQDPDSNNLHLLPQLIKETEPSAFIVTSKGGGESLLVVPEAIAEGKIRIEIKSISNVLTKIRVITKRLRVKSRIPIKVNRLRLVLTSSEHSLIISSFIKSLTLNIRTSELKLDEDKS